MEETFEELVTKHTRRELEEMAMNYGVENLGGTKSQLAEAIVEARKQKESPKPAEREMPKRVPMAEKPEIKAVGTAKPMRPAKKGVMAKISAINSESSELQRAGRGIRETGIHEMNDRVREFQSASNSMSRDMAARAKKMTDEGQQRFNANQAAFKSSLDEHKQKLNADLATFKGHLDAQIKENKEAAAKLDSGAREIRSATEKMAMDFQKAGKDIREEGYRNLQKGLNEFNSSVNSQIKANQDAISRINSAVRAFQDEVHRYQEQDLKNYIQDFYYG